MVQAERRGHKGDQWLRDRLIHERRTAERNQPSADSFFQGLLRSRNQGNFRGEHLKQLITSFEERVLLEDDDVLVLNKPQGVLSCANDSVTRFGIAEVSRFVRNTSISLVNRLDVDTTGVIVLGKNEDAALRLSQQFAEKESSKLVKVYLTLLDGEFSDTLPRKVTVGIQARGERKMGIVKTGHYNPSDKSVQRSETHFMPSILFQTSEENPDYRTLTGVQIITGRRHQIRVTAAEALGLPITGDQLYNPNPSGADRPLLHSFGITFTHPRTQKRVIVEAPVPDDFITALSQMKQVRIYERKKQ